jgi:hypothetical protein
MLQPLFLDADDADITDKRGSRQGFGVGAAVYIPPWHRSVFVRVIRVIRVQMNAFCRDAAVEHALGAGGATITLSRRNLPS